MSFEEKIEFIEQEIRLLHKFCLDSGYTPKQIRKSAEPFLRPYEKAQEQRHYKYIAVLALVVAFLGAVLYVDPVYRTLLASARIGTIKVMQVVYT